MVRVRTLQLFAVCTPRLTCVVKISRVTVSIDLTLTSLLPWRRCSAHMQLYGACLGPVRLHLWFRLDGSQDPCCLF